VLALRDHDGAVRAYRNACRVRPHALTRSRRGRFDGAIICAADGARYGLDGGAVMGARGLHPVEVAIRQGLLFVRLAGLREGLPPDVSQLFNFAFDRMAPLGPDIEIAAAADWRRVVEQALDGPAAEAGAANHVLLSLPPPLGWSAARYDAILASSDLAGDTVRRAWRRVVVFPGIIIDLRLDGVSIRQVTPLAPGRCRIALRRYGPAANGRAGRALAWLARRIEAEGLARDIAIAESTEAGLGAPLYAPGDDMGETDASRRLREWIAPRLARVAHS
jgi:phenylpropionate dioxygenase-like ring-hydroxylating dioxygenase large terminal subunit